MRIAFLAFEGVEELDLTGPWELCGGLADNSKGLAAFVVAESMEPLTCARGLRMLPHYSFADCPDFDVLLVPGGPGRKKEVNNPALINFVKEHAQACQYVLSVCTGAFILQKAGLLQGHKATTYWAVLTELRALGVDVVEERWVRDGKIWTSSGVSAGMDLMLAFLAAKLGEETAADAQFTAEYFPEGKRYGEPEKRIGAPGYLRAST